MTHHELVKAVAAALGARAVMKDDHEGYGRIEGAGCPVGLYHDTYRKRVSVSVCWPTHTEDGGNRYTQEPKNFLPREEYNAAPPDDMTVSAERGAAAIAKDIKRRLIEPNAPLFARAVQRIHDFEEARRIRNEIAAGILEQFPTHYRAMRDAPNALTTNLKFYRLPDVKVNAADSVRFEGFTVTPETACKLLAILTADAEPIE